MAGENRRCKKTGVTEVPILTTTEATTSTTTEKSISGPEITTRPEITTTAFANETDSDGNGWLVVLLILFFSILGSVLYFLRDQLGLTWNDIQ